MAAVGAGAGLLGLALGRVRATGTEPSATSVAGAEPSATSVAAA
jgi:hypothetical protein